MEAKARGGMRKVLRGKEMGQVTPKGVIISVRQVSDHARQPSRLSRSKQWPTQCASEVCSESVIRSSGRDNFRRDRGSRGSACATRGEGHLTPTHLRSHSPTRSCQALIMQGARCMHVMVTACTCGRRGIDRKCCLATRDNS